MIARCKNSHITTLPTKASITTIRSGGNMRNSLIVSNLHWVIAFDRDSLEDPRKAPDSLSGKFGALHSAQIKLFKERNKLLKLLRKWLP